MKKLLIFASVAFLFFISCNEDKEKKSGRSMNVQDKIITSSDDAVVKTTSGMVAGYIDGWVYIYKGIPYAEAERFMPPVAPEPWEGVRSSRAYGPTCPQGKRMGWYSDEQAFAFDWDDGFPDENCLRVNIWTTGLNNGKKRPVMVWLHGGGYSAGSGQELPSYDGKSLCETGDVVVVSLNHRLNVLGFLDLSAFGDKYAKSGNVGLLDLIAALQWIKDNISAFGGDPSNVTIFGQSGGGGKVSTLLATPSAAGLFHKAIVQSGSMLQTMTTKYSRRIGAAVVEELGIKASHIDDIKNVPYERLLEAGNKAVAKVRGEADKEGFSTFLFGWGPTVDGDILPTQPFDPQAPAISKDIPLMVGSTLHEFMSSAYNSSLKNITIDVAKSELEKRFGPRTNDFIKAFGAVYPNFKPVDLFDVDLIFRPGVVRQATLKAAQQGAPVFMYMFAWESPVLNGKFRSTHCMELPFVFNNISRCRNMTGDSEDAYALADLMSRSWINFAKTGNPNAEGLPEWKQYIPEEGATMFFDKTCVIKYNHDKELLDIAYSFPIRGF